MNTLQTRALEQSRATLLDVICLAEELGRHVTPSGRALLAEISGSLVEADEWIQAVIDDTRPGGTPAAPVLRAANSNG